MSKNLNIAIQAIAVLCVSIYVVAVLYGIPFQDPKLIYGRGLLAKTGSNDRYSIFNVHNVDTCKSALENYKSGKSTFAPELLVFFFVNGNKGYRY